MRSLSEIYNELYSQYFSQMEKESKKILSNDDYMIWLVQFTEVYPQFTDNQWLDDEDNIGENDYLNVTKLRCIFWAIEKYAYENFLAPNLKDSNPYYIISFNGIHFEIGKIIGTAFYCKRKKGNWDAIQFSDINYYFKSTAH